MDSPGLRSSPTISLLALLLLCLLSSNASVGFSLLSKNTKLNESLCLWEQQPGIEDHPLNELSVCALVRLNHRGPWTGFVYKAPGRENIELGLQGTGSSLDVWLLGKKVRVETKLEQNQWYFICITWSGPAQRLHIYIDGIDQSKTSAGPFRPRLLASNGTLSLGVSNYVDAARQVTMEDGCELFGAIGRFWMWDREQSVEELRGRMCADGDALDLDPDQWGYGCSHEPDQRFGSEWSHYKVEVGECVLSAECDRSSISQKEVTSDWMQSVFPGNFYIHDIQATSIPCDSDPFTRVNNSAVPRTQQTQESGESINSPRASCFRSEVLVRVDPAADITEVRRKVKELLSVPVSRSCHCVISNPDVLHIQPVEVFTTNDVTATASLSTSDKTEPTAVPSATSVSTKEESESSNLMFGKPCFFRVDLTLTVTGGPLNLTFIEIWVTRKLKRVPTLKVMNLVVTRKSSRNAEQHEGDALPQDQQTQCLCSFHVQEDGNGTEDETKNAITSALMSHNDNSSIQPLTPVIQLITPKNCPSETMWTIHGEFLWDETPPQEIRQIICARPDSERADRLCKLHIETDTTSWASPVMTNCEATVIISDIDNITVTTENGAQVVDLIQELVDGQLSGSEKLEPSELKSVVRKLSEVVNVGGVKPSVGTKIVDIIASILLSETDILPVADTVLNLTDNMGSSMDFPEELASVAAPLLDVSMVNVCAGDFRGLTYAVSEPSSPSTLNPETFLNQSYITQPLPNSDATISLPIKLSHYLKPGQRNETRIQFHFYGTQKLFQDLEISNNTDSKWTLNSFVVSASVNGSHVSNLSENVVVTLRHQTAKKLQDEVRCVFWDFQKNNGQGGWSRSDCVTENLSPDQTRCFCDHLTHFAVLLRVSREPISHLNNRVLTLVTYVGCGVSSIFLGITLLTYISFEKLRRDNPSKILINLSAALLGLNLLFLLNPWLSSFSKVGLSIATAAIQHYLLLASFMWMGLEAVHMYLALVKVFNTYISSYMLKLCAIGWGIPVVIVGLVLVIKKDAYGIISIQEDAPLSTTFGELWWLQDNPAFYGAVVAPVLLILLGNMSVFVMVLIQIRKIRTNKSSSSSRSAVQDLRAVASISVLLGLTWTTGFFSFGPSNVVALYVFTICNSFQGFFVFLFHCLMKENVRKQWRIHLCCGRFRLHSCAEWSDGVTAAPDDRKSNLVHSDSVTSDSPIVRKVSDSSMDSTKQRQC